MFIKFYRLVLVYYQLHPPLDPCGAATLVDALFVYLMSTNASFYAHLCNLITLDNVLKR